MPRYAAANFAAIDPEFRKANKINSGGSNKKSRYAYGQDNRVLVLAGRDLLANGLCLRLLPIYDSGTINSSEPQLATFREGPNDEAFGDWCRLWTAAHWVGNPGICFNVHDGNPDINLYESPLHVLRKVAYDSIKEHAHPTLGKLFDDLLAKNQIKDSHVGSLKKPEKTLYISASIVTTGPDGSVVLSAFSDDERKNARVIGLKTSAAESLKSALAVTNDRGEYVSGDMLSLSDAKLFTVLPESFKSGDKTVSGLSVEGPAGFHCPKFARSDRGLYVVGYPRSRSDYTHFGILHDTYNNQPVSLDSYAEQIVGEQLTLDNYLYLPSYEEQAEMLAPVFPREALDYAWRDFPEYLRALPKNTTTVVMPSAVAASVSPAKHTILAVAEDLTFTAPWDTAAEPAPEDVESVSEMFSAAPAAPAVPAGAATPPPPPPASAVPAKKVTHEEILARARATKSSAAAR